MPFIGLGQPQAQPRASKPAPCLSTTLLPIKPAITSYGPGDAQRHLLLCLQDDSRECAAIVHPQRFACATNRSRSYGPLSFAHSARFASWCDRHRLTPRNRPKLSSTNSARLNRLASLSPWRDQKTCGFAHSSAPGGRRIFGERNFYFTSREAKCRALYSCDPANRAR